MRFGPAIGVGIGLVLVLPAVSAPQKAADLERALSETVRALAVLTGLENDVRSRPAAEAVELVYTVTEPPVGDERSRDEELQLLRKDVGRLQMAWDELSRGAAIPAAPADTSAPAEARAPGALPITTGMDDRMRAALSSEPLLPSLRRPRTSPAPGAPSAGPAHDDAADALRQGQALLRAGKAKEALIVLRAVEGDVRARYWTARALEKLDRVEEALDLYQLVAKDEGAGYLAARARNDAEFLEWKREFVRKLGKDAAAPGARPATAPARQDTPPKAKEGS